MKKVQRITTKPKNPSLLWNMLGRVVEVGTRDEISTQNAEGEIVSARVAFRGLVVDIDDTWLVLGHIDQNLEPVYQKLLKIDDISSVDLAAEEGAPSDNSEIN